MVYGTKKCHIIIYLSYIFSSLLAHVHLLTFSILLSRNNESAAVTAIDIDKKKEVIFHRTIR